MDGQVMAPAKRPDMTESFNVRLSTEVLAGLDAWVAEMNARRRLGHVTRAALVRRVLEWAVEHRPDVEAMAPTPPREQ